MMATKVALNHAGLAKIRKLAGLHTNKELAERIDVDTSTVSRVLAGKTSPGPTFIAGCVAAFGAECFEDCFIVERDEVA